MKRIFWGIFAIAFFGSASAYESHEPDIDRKMEQCVAIVSDAIKFFKEKPLGEACRAFQRDLTWRKGEIFPFVFDADGTCFVHDDDLTVIWKTFNTTKAGAGESLIQRMLKSAENGGWVSYEWDNGYKLSYVKMVKKGEKNFIIGAGFFPESPEFKTKQLVKSAITFLQDNGAQELADRINNPVGQFVRGDIYLWVYDLEGTVFAHGENLAMVGQNLIDW